MYRVATSHNIMPRCASVAATRVLLRRVLAGSPAWAAPKRRVSLLHSKMSSADKNRTLTEFASGPDEEGGHGGLRVLVSTSIIEVSGPFPRPLAPDPPDPPDPPGEAVGAGLRRVLLAGCASCVGACGSDWFPRSVRGFLFDRNGYLVSDAVGRRVWHQSGISLASDEDR